MLMYKRVPAEIVVIDRGLQSPAEESYENSRLQTTEFYPQKNRRQVIFSTSWNTQRKVKNSSDMFVAGFWIVATHNLVWIG
jgi:hypothetical protein